MRRDNYIQQFNELANPFFEADLLKEIYKDDFVSICNVANTTYALFSYDSLCEGKENFAGILFNGNYLEQVIENPPALINAYLRKDAKKQKGLLVPLNAKSFKIMQEMKRKTDTFGATNEINLQLEEEIMAKYKSK